MGRMLSVAFLFGGAFALWSCDIDNGKGDCDKTCFDTFEDCTIECDEEDEDCFADCEDGEDLCLGTCDEEGDDDDDDDDDDDY